MVEIRLADDVASMLSPHHFQNVQVKEGNAALDECNGRIREMSARLQEVEKVKSSLQVPPRYCIPLSSPMRNSMLKLSSHALLHFALLPSSFPNEERNNREAEG